MNDKRIKYISLIILILSVIIVILSFFLKTVILNDYKIKHVEISKYENGNIEFTIDFDKLYKDKDYYCLISEKNDIKKINNDGFIKEDNNKCTFYSKLNDYYIFFKIDNKIYQTNTKLSDYENRILDFNINSKSSYLAVSDSTEIDASVISIGKVNKSIKWESSNPNVATINNGKVVAISTGTATITATVDEFSKTTNIVVTNIIDVMPNEFNFKKGVLSCNRYSSSEAQLLDNILSDRVEKSGYATRAGVVAAARFITLEFKYIVPYFPENGNMNTYSGNYEADGEGRYYYKGLYLDNSKYSIIEKSKYGPQTWGCYLYTYIKEKEMQNGLDCSGFVTWALLNGGFDVGDLGAGPTTSLPVDLSNIGDRNTLTLELLNSGKIKTGDLLNFGIWEESHTAIIVGIKDDIYYVAESLWYTPDFGVVIEKYNKQQLINMFGMVVLMDSVYKEDGNYTQMWN